MWFIAYPVIGQLAFLFFVISTLAAENRVPFDILEAESELVAGFRVEYSGMKFAIIQLGEYAHIIGSSFLGALLFLGHSESLFNVSAAYELVGKTVYRRVEP